jgi:hypothetical protein
MGKYKERTTATAASVTGFIDGLGSPSRKEEASRLQDMDSGVLKEILGRSRAEAKKQWPVTAS